MKKRRLLSFGFLFLLTLALEACSNQSQSSGKTVIKVATQIQHHLLTKKMTPLKVTILMW